MKIQVKVCGITTVADALAAQAAGVTAVGFIFTHSPRQVGLPTATAISSAVSRDIVRVGVFAGEDAALINRAAREVPLDLAQIHGRCGKDENILEIPVIRAFRARDPGVLETIRKAGVRRFLLDAFVPGLPGGTGVLVDPELAARAARLGRMVLAGGLTPHNVNRIVRQVRPGAVDVCSGVELVPGRKNHEAMTIFVEEVNRCSCQTPTVSSAGSADGLYRKR